MPADPPRVERALTYAREHASRFVSELTEFVGIPSVSAEPAHASDVRHAAEWLRDRLRAAGLRGARFIATRGAPLVTAEHRGAPRAPTLLVYGHYDVQPIGCMSDWRTPPFDPVIRNGEIVGRGASDDKGQLLAHVNAIESWLRSGKHLPINVICLFEGEEEIGSPSLEHFLAGRGHELGADAALISDTRMRGARRPAVTYGLRGKIGLELEVRRPGHEVHAGQFGGAIDDPAHVLARAIASLHDDAGRVAVAGMRDGVRSAGAYERRYLARAAPRNAELLAAAGVPGHDSAASLYERTTLAPAITVTAMNAGAPGGHHAAAIPTCATATLDVRIVPDQDPQAIVRAIDAHARAFSTPQCTVITRVHSACPAVVLDVQQPPLRAAARAAARAFNTDPVFLRSGGTIPIVNTLAAVGVTPVLLGFALSDDGMHAPNEHFALARYARATECSIRFFPEYAHDHRLALSRRAGRRDHGAVGHERTAR